MRPIENILHPTLSNVSAIYMLVNEIYSNRLISIHFFQNIELDGAQNTYD